MNINVFVKVYRAFRKFMLAHFDFQPTVERSRQAFHPVCLPGCVGVVETLKTTQRRSSGSCCLGSGNGKGSGMNVCVWQGRKGRHQRGKTAAEKGESFRCVQWEAVGVRKLVRLN